ncbi:Adaptive-response sensory-kinase SasA [Flavobacterium bizetiae]|uniref:histidine kinase n=2 Tax=Flavobacterium bizetiae TaxID=2704140 RepID=A0A6J4GA60_9FLAO|nr:HAMP domain-containing sensor histidine kinase [Flavobacterium bizetiae]CAA9196063.1 Adaptive-response sensory-kinase SasA [Flavobacterium bizetiae]CAD5346587.1 Adaptive-response sensory-kinase SasA [Flavobacterium bizetiae]
MKKTGFLFLLFINLTVFAQQEPILAKYKTQPEKLKAWLKYTNEVLDTEDYPKLIVAAQKGIELSKDQLAYKSRFYFLKGNAYEFNNNQTKEASINYEIALKFAQKARHLKNETSILMRLSYAYYALNETLKRKELITYIKQVVDTTKSTYTKSVLYGSLGEYYLDNAQYETFISYQLKAINYKKLLKKTVANDETIGVSYSQIAAAYTKMKQYNKAIEYLNYAQPYIKTSPYISAFSCNYYLQCFVPLKNLDSIQKYYNLAYTFPSKKDSLFLNLSFANRSVSEYYANEGQINTAFSYAKKAVLLGQKSNDQDIIMEANAVMGRVLYEKGEYKKAIETLKKASKNALTYDKESFVNINKKLSQSYAALGLWKDAFYYNEIYSKSNDEMMQESAKQNIANAEARYQNKTKGQEIKNLSTQNTLKNIQIDEAKKQRIFLISGLILVGIIVLLLFKQNQNRKKTNEKLQLLNQELDEANKIKARFFSILNHDLRSPVSNLIHFLHLQKESPELIDEEMAARMQTKVITGAENLLSSMEDILLWSKGQMENFKPHFKEITVDVIFKEIKNHFSGIENIQISFENPENLILNTDENYLKTIIRNLTGNAIKALDKTTNGKIIWKAWQENDVQYLSISDNGPGGTQEQFKALYDDSEVIGIKSGLGLHLIRDLATAINCKIEVKSQHDSGTTFTIKVCHELH